MRKVMLTVGAENETLTGTDLSDTLVANSGDDVIYGLGGGDILTGDAGRDYLLGDDGAAQETVVLGANKSGGEVALADVVNDYLHGTKTIVLQGLGTVSFWEDFNNPGQSLIAMDVTDSSFTLLKEEVKLTAASSDNQESPTAAALTDGGFVVTWVDDGGGLGDGSGDAIIAQVFDANGDAANPPFRVNTATTYGQTSPSVSALEDGFVIVWADESATGDIDTAENSYDIRGQIFGNTGSPSGTEFIVNAVHLGAQESPKVTTLLNGNFVVTWMDMNGSGADTASSSIRAQIFSATGGALGSTFLVNTTAASSQEFPSIAALAGGGFVVVWQDLSQSANDPSGSATRGQVFAANGTALGDEFLVNTTTAGSQYAATVTATAGGFSVTWVDQPDAGSATVRRQDFTVATEVIPVNDNDTLYGGDDADTLEGGRGADILYGGFGDDHFVLVDTLDQIFDDGGIDTIYSAVTMSIAGTAFAMIEHAALSGSANTGLTGNALDNMLSGNMGGNALLGGAGRDQLYGYAGNDTVYGGTEGDFATGNEGNDGMFGEAGGDTLLGGAGGDTLYGGADNDSLNGETESDTLYGGDGRDALTGDTGHDRLFGDLGNDTIRAGLDNDLAYGGSENDLIYGDTGNDSLYGGTGRDAIYGDAGNDVVNGGGDADILYGGVGRDQLLGDTGADSLRGGTDSDLLYGGSDRDFIAGEAGNDIIYGGAGGDLLYGGGESDVFKFAALSDMTLSSTTSDVIFDFTRGKDKIDLSAIDASVFFGSNDKFTFLGTKTIGTSKAGEISFQKVDNALDKNDYTLVRIDTDGDSSAEAVIKLMGLYTMTSADFAL